MSTFNEKIVRVTKFISDNLQNPPIVLIGIFKEDLTNPNYLWLEPLPRQTNGANSFVLGIKPGVDGLTKVLFDKKTIITEIDEKHIGPFDPDVYETFQKESAKEEYHD